MLRQSVRIFLTSFFSQRNRWRKRQMRPWIKELERSWRENTELTAILWTPELRIKIQRRDSESLRPNVAARKKEQEGGKRQHLLGINRADIQHLEHAWPIQLLLIHSCNRSPAKYIILDFTLNTSSPFPHSFPWTFSSLFIVRHGISLHSLSQRVRGVIVLCWNRWCFIGPASHTAFDTAVRKAIFWGVFLGGVSF